MATGFLHMHTTVVILFLLFYTYKVFLLLSGQNERLTFIRNKTKIVEIIIGTLILVTGVYLFVINPLKETWLWVKLFVVTAFIPLSIVAMKKENKVLGIITLVGFLYFMAVSYTKSLTFSRPKIEISDNEIIKTDEVESNETKTESDEILSNLNKNVLNRGKSVYNVACVSCHGNEGDAMVGGAKNLKISKLTVEEKLNIVKNGKGLMMAYKNQLSEQDIEAVVAYVETLVSK
ncbi:MAG: SirB2 family protein [Cytophagales bacterium]